MASCERCIHKYCCQYDRFLGVEDVENKCNYFKDTADVVEVVHAKWEISSDGYYPYCTHCKTEPENGVMSNYCPNCGAKMDGDVKSTDHSGDINKMVQNQWISVNDRLPKNGLARVLVFLRDDEYTKNIGFNKIDTDRCVNGEWVRWGRHVTHWMRLPAPPKGE